MFEDKMRPIPRPLHPVPDDFVGHGFEVVGPSDPGEKVNKGGRQVELVVSHLCSLVVPGEGVMVVVPPFAKGPECDGFVLCRVDVLVIGSIPPHVSSTVHEPSGVEVEAVAELCSEAPGHDEALSPKVPRHKGWDQKAEEEDEWSVVVLLEHDDGISFQVRHVDCLPLLLDQDVLSCHEPPNMSKEEPPLGIMRVRMSLGVFMMGPVIPTPLMHGVLKRHSLTEGEEDPQWKRGFVALVCPEPMSSCCDPKGSEKVPHPRPNEGPPPHLPTEEEIEPCRCRDVKVGEEGHVPPHDLEGREVVGVDVLEAWVLDGVFRRLAPWTEGVPVRCGHGGCRVGGTVWRHGWLVVFGMCITERERSVPSLSTCFFFFGKRSPSSSRIVDDNSIRCNESSYVPISTLLHRRMRKFRISTTG